MQRKPLAFITLATVLSTAACATPPRSMTLVAESGVNASKPERSGAININTASRQALEHLPGVGSAIAERIVAHREQYGPFRRAEHLMMVRGISDTKFRKLRTMISVD